MGVKRDGGLPILKLDLINDWLDIYANWILNKQLNPYIKLKLGINYFASVRSEIDSVIDSVLASHDVIAEPGGETEQG